MSATISLQAKRGAILAAAGLLLGLGAAAQTGTTSHGVLAHLTAAEVSGYSAVVVSGSRNLYLVQPNSNETDQQLLTALQAYDPTAELNTEMGLAQSTASVLNGQSTASVLNQSTASVLNEQSTASVLNQSTASVLNGQVDYFGTRAPSQYTNQAAVGQIHAGAPAFALGTGRGAIVALIDNGVDPFNPVLRKVLLRQEGYNFVDNNHNWSAWADLGQSTASVLNGQSTASVLNGQSTASVLNGQSTASVLNQSTASVLNSLQELLDQSTASVLNGQSTASVLNSLVALLSQSTASVLNGCSTGGALAQSTASVLNGQSTASVLNGQSTASVLNGLGILYLRQSTASVLNQSTASVLNGEILQQLLFKLVTNILSCDPDFGHGTAVAGLIHLVAPEAKILPIKAFGSDGQADTTTIIESIDYAVAHGADVINMSFSSDQSDPDVAEAVAAAEQAGVAVVAAAGNGDANNDTPTDAAMFPASLPGVFGVAAVDGCGAATVNGPCVANPPLTLAAFSNFDTLGNNWQDAAVGAPGVELFTTFPGFGLIWATSSGTSFSTPLVAGEAALLAGLRKASSGLTSSADPSVLADNRGQIGAGLVNVTGALLTAPPSTAQDNDTNNHSGHGHHGGH